MDLILRPHEFSQDAGVVVVKHGQTIAQMLAEACGGDDYAGEYLEVRVTGYVVPAEMWHRVRPKEGAIIHVTRMSLNGGGARQIIGAIAMIALTYFTFGGGAIAGWSLGTASSLGTLAVQAGVYMLGSLAISALTKPPSPPGQGEAGQRWNALTGSSNQINPGGAIPFVIGESRFFPPHAAIPYSESVGEDSYQICMFDLGYGDITVSDIRIGETPITSYENVQYEVTKNPTLYTNDVSEVNVGATLDNGDTVTRNTSPNITRVAIDLVAIQGLYGVGNTGKKFVTWVTFNIQYRPVGSATWLNPPAPSLSFLTSLGAGNYEARRQHADAYACGIAWDVPAGQYEIKVSRTGSHTGASHNTFVQDFTWSSMRSIKYTLPSTTGTNKLAMRIKATDQLNGTLQTLSCHVQQKIRVHDRVTNTWSAPEVNINPAWVAYWLLTECPSFSKLVTPGRVHLDTFDDYAEFCTANSFEARGVVDAATTAGQLIEDVLSCSLGSLGMRDGRYSVVFDSGDTLPSTVFTPLEISEFTMTRQFLLLPQALRVQFKNPAADYQDDEIIVLDDGFSYRGVDARGNPSSLPEPERFETMQLRFAQDAIHAWRVGRFHLAQGKFRPETYSFSSDIAGLGTTRGDVVHVSHDVPEWGIAWGRVLAVAVESGNTVVTLDQDVVAEPGKSYSAQVRKQYGDTSAINIVSLYGQTNTITLSGTGHGITVGDAIAIGEVSTVTEKLLVSSVRYSDGGNVTSFDAVRYSPQVKPYWSNPPASIASEITGNMYGEVPTPVITGVISDSLHSDPDDAGILAPEISISTGRRNEPLYFETQAR